MPLERNQLTGTITSEIGLLTKLGELYFCKLGILFRGEQKTLVVQRNDMKKLFFISSHGQNCIHWFDSSFLAFFLFIFIFEKMKINYLAHFQVKWEC